MPITESAIVTFLTQRTAKKGDPCTLTNQKGAQSGLPPKVYIRDDEYTQFFDLLNEHLFIKKLRPLNLIEQKRPDGYFPLLVDLDFKYLPEKSLQRQFNVDHIKSFIQNYISVVEYFYDITKIGENDPNCSKLLRFFVSLRPTPYEDKKPTGKAVKDGIHIVCPDLILHSEHQQIIRNKAIESSIISNSFEGVEYINGEKDIYDETVVKKNGWFYYGESKADIPAYMLEFVYVYDPNTRSYETQDASEYGTRELIEELSIRYDVHNKHIPFVEENHDEWKQRLEYCIGGYDSTTAIADVQDNNINAAARALFGPQQYSHIEIELAKKIARKCLSPSRADCYTTWMEVGWCLHSIDPSEDMFNVWMEFSDKSGKAGNNNTNMLFRDWNRNWNRRDSDRKFTIRSLHMWAKEDNLSEWKKIMQEDIINYVQNNVDATHTHIARLMHKMYCNDYKAAVDSKKTEWYEFKNNYWRKIAQGIDIRNKMSTEVADVISEVRDRARNRMISFKEGSYDRNFEEAQLKRYLSIENKLYTSGFKDSVMKECVGLFYDDEFYNKLNSDPYLIGFANGVVNLHAERMLSNGEKEYYVEFREGKPDDYISFMAGRWLPKQCEPIEYISYNPEDQEQKEIDEFMTKVFPRKDLRDYMWRKLASCLEGTNREQTYETWIGVGGNGKSKLVDLMSMAMGDYATSMQSTVLTRKRPDSGAANPDIMAIRNRRFIYMAEPDDREPLNTSRMKQMTGEDVVEARGLFEDQTKFQITGKMFMLCNAFPAINTMDRGTWRRVQAVPFVSKFVDPHSPDIDHSKHIYPRDNFLDIKLKRWRAPFIARLIYIYEKEYLKNGIEPVPDIVKQESNKYREMFDSFGKFKASRIREEIGQEAVIKDIWRVYKNWVEGVGGGGRRLTMQELQKRLDDEFGQPYDRKTYKRVLLFDSDEDIEEYDNSKRLNEDDCEDDDDENGENEE